MAHAAPGLYRALVVGEALRSLSDEPAVRDPPPRTWRDWALVALFLVGGALEAVLREDLEWRPVAFVVSSTPVVLLPWRRTHPLAVCVAAFGAHFAANLAVLAGPDRSILLDSGAYVLLLPYALTRWGSGRDAVLGMAFVGVTSLIGESVNSDVFLAVLAVLVLFGIAELGALVRYRVAGKAREAEQIKLREREQLARELHDTVAHHVSAIAVQAQAGRTVAASRPEAAVQALEVIEEAASRTLTEMRALVEALRQGEEPDLAPRRGVADIARLADGAGQEPRVDVALAGRLEDLRPLVDAAIYRLAQESITNARRHARHASRIEVRVAGDDDAVRLTVRDDGRVAHAGGGAAQGYGLTGMRERATLLGGTLDAGPDPGGGWTVTAVLPRDGAGR